MNKKKLFLLPEILLILLSLYWLVDNFLFNNYFNVIGFVVFLILLVQLYYQNKYVGLLLATLIFLFSIYMVLAVLSEFHEFKTVDTKAIQLIGFGFILCYLMFGAAILMFYKFLRKVF
jgi:hypothetical protein